MFDLFNPNPKPAPSSLPPIRPGDLHKDNSFVGPMEQPDPNAMMRQQQFADALRQKSEEVPQGSMVGGHFVAPSAIQQANPLLAQAARAYNSYTGS